jgi:hypothetical protein
MAHGRVINRPAVCLESSVPLTCSDISVFLLVPHLFSHTHMHRVCNFFMEEYGVGLVYVCACVYVYVCVCECECVCVSGNVCISVCACVCICGSIQK